LPTSGWSSISGVDDARRPRSTGAKDDREMSAEHSRALPAHISEKLLYLCSRSACGRSPAAAVLGRRTPPGGKRLS
jgi:hypothetical protein